MKCHESHGCAEKKKDQVPPKCTVFSLSCSYSNGPSENTIFSHTQAIVIPGQLGPRWIVWKWRILWVTTGNTIFSTIQVGILASNHKQTVERSLQPPVRSTSGERSYKSSPIIWHSTVANFDPNQKSIEEVVCFRRLSMYVACVYIYMYTHIHIVISIYIYTCVWYYICTQVSCIYILYT